MLSLFRLSLALKLRSELIGRLCARSSSSLARTAWKLISWSGPYLKC